MIPTFGTTSRHDQRSIIPSQLLHTNITDIASDLGQHRGDLSLERLFLITPWTVFQFARLGFLDQEGARRVRLFDKLVLFLAECRAGDNIVDAEGESDVSWDDRSGEMV